MDNLKCKDCIWAFRRHFDTSMRLCKWYNVEVWGESVPCDMFETNEWENEENKIRKGAVQ